MSGTRYFWATGAAASVRRLATSPRTATTLSCVISFVTALDASSGRLWSSSTSNLILRPPSTPPASLISWTASCAPSTEDCPNDAPSPVSDPYMPTTISPVVSCPVPGRRSQAVLMAATHAKNNTMGRRIFIGRIIKEYGWHPNDCAPRRRNHPCTRDRHLDHGRQAAHARG